MQLPGFKGQRAIAALMLVAGLVYLIQFVPRGWIPHDEGMLGQSAERVLLGDIPHIDYEEPYTGGLSWLYAGVFRISGIDLLNLRWALFAGAAVVLWLMYAISRRYLSPIAAALATWVGLVWSFPNYFAPIPSWWLLVCALACMWAFIRYVETGEWRYIAAAGVSTGMAMAIKQTGAYLFVALLLSLLYEGGRSDRPHSVWVSLEGVLRWALSATAIGAAWLILATRMFGGEGLYLFVPVAACGVVLLLPTRKRSAHSPVISPLSAILIAGAAAAVPIVILLAPYVVHHRLWDFVSGAFILPRKRLAFASADMPPARFIATGIPVLALVLPVSRFLLGSRLRIVAGLLWGAAIALPIIALRNATAYQAIWQSARAFAALLPMAICWRLATHHIHDAGQRRILFMSASMLAWASLNQFPFAAPIYFCYVAPLAVIAGVALASASFSLRPRTILPWAAMLLLFGTLSANRGYLPTLGVSHQPVRFDAPLKLPRAHLNLEANQVEIYRRVVYLIAWHLRGGLLMAGPDCPQVYFLSGLVSPSGTLFDFFAADSGRPSYGDVASWLKAEVIVINHTPEFSPAPSNELSEALRREFPGGQDVAQFEVRWR